MKKTMMKFEAIIADIIPFHDEKEKEKVLRDGITCVDISTILGIKMKDGEGILLSKESWKRLELFMVMLSSVKMAIDEDKLKKYLGVE